MARAVPPPPGGFRDGRRVARRRDVARTVRPGAPARSSAPAGLAAIEEAGPFDLILCDMMMPEMGGESVYEHLNAARDPHAGRMVFMTGGVFVPRVVDFLSQFDDRTLSKPFQKHQLREVVAHMATR